MKRLGEEIRAILDAQPGDWGLAWLDLNTGEKVFYREDDLFIAASVIKIPIIIEAYRQDRQGKISLNDPMPLQAKDIVGGCGVLQVMHHGIPLTVKDVLALMITVSDNTATNMMIELLGIPAINEVMQTMGVRHSALRRKMFDLEKSRQGIQNHITPADVLLMFEALYRGTVVDREACDEILTLLRYQQLNHKIPVALPEGTKVAHKTGEDSGQTHDAGIVYVPGHPFLLVVLSEHVPDTAVGHQVIARIARMAYDYCAGQ